MEFKRRWMRLRRWHLFLRGVEVEFKQISLSVRRSENALLAALTAIFAKIGLEGINSHFATFIRAIIIAFCLAVFLSYAKAWQPLSSLSSRNWVFLILSGLASGASWLAYFKALQIGKAYQVAPIDKISVVLVVIIAVIFLGERPSLREWLALALIGAGVMMLAFK